MVNYSPFTAQHLLRLSRAASSETENKFHCCKMADSTLETILGALYVQSF